MQARPIPEVPAIKTAPHEDPDNADKAKRSSFYAHKNHYFALTLAGKPIFTRHCCCLL